MATNKYVRRYWEKVKEESIASPNQTIKLGRILRNRAKYLHDKYEDYCNGRDRFSKKEITDAWLERLEAIEDSTTEIARKMGFGLIHQRDPRGASLKIVLPSGYTNDWGNEGLIVPMIGERI